MTDITPVGRSQPAGMGAPARNDRIPTLPAFPQRGTDQVEVSPAARYLARLQEMPQVRIELVERIRSQIAAGTYDSPEKLLAAIDSMIEDLA